MYYADREAKFKAVTVLKDVYISGGSIDCKFNEGLLMIDSIAASDESKDTNKVDHTVKMITAKGKELWKNYTLEQSKKFMRFFGNNVVEVK